ncbi:hypothetical protein LDENG_00084870 [Lucifuga dentata]|nr:hypothetical protein LDENG_00084870 [Lucifuga dentata]
MNPVRAATVFLALLYPLILAVIIGLGIQTRHDIQDQTSCSIKTNKLVLNNMDLTIQRDELQWNNSKLKSSILKESQRITLLKTAREELEVTISNLKRDRDYLKEWLLPGKYCPEKWMWFGSSCYFFSDSEENWFNSKRDCQTKNAQLVKITNEKEQKFISTFLKKKAWIGLTDTDTENVFKWLDGTGLTINYWDVGEPNNKEKKQNCVVNTGSSAKWRDVVCTDLFHYICQRYVGY